jgi:hypothetical protein
MTLYERLEELKANTNLETNPHETYLEAEAVLVALLSEQILGAEVRTNNDGIGTVINSGGLTINNMIMTLAFSSDVTKCFAVEPIISGKVFFSKFVDNTELFDAWKAINDFHTELTKQYNKIKAAELDAVREAKKQEAADKKASEKYEHQRAKALKDFEILANQEKAVVTEADAFYYSLGWLAKHATNVAAVLPDYLADAFKKYFGADTPCRIVDSKHRGPAGWQAQWSWSFTISLKKPDLVPAFLSDKLNPSGKAVSKTSFVWDLVDTYGFKFGKEQDIDNIRAHIPSDYLASFEAGLA